MKSHQKCYKTYINEVWCNGISITNVISMINMTEKFRVMMYLEEELTLLLHIPNKILKFKQFSDSLYAIDPHKENRYLLTKKEYQFMNTIEENIKCISQG